jgi:hypothetical protein
MPSDTSRTRRLESAPPLATVESLPQSRSAAVATGQSLAIIQRPVIARAIAKGRRGFDRRKGRKEIRFTALHTVDQGAVLTGSGSLMVLVLSRATVRCMADHANDPVRSRLTFRVRCSITTTVVSILTFGIACDRNIEPYQPGEEASSPDLARIFPGPPSSAESAQDLSDSSRAPDRTALPPSRAEGSGVSTAATAESAMASATGESAPIEGLVELSDELGSLRPAGAVLFVIARPQGVKRGPPLAVLRIADPEFPYAFSIGPADVMIPSMRFEGAISLSARLDADGNAMTRSPEDISSPTLSSLAPGATGVKLDLTDRG